MHFFLPVCNFKSPFPLTLMCKIFSLKFFSEFYITQIMGHYKTLTCSFFFAIPMVSFVHTGNFTSIHVEDSRSFNTISVPPSTGSVKRTV